MSDDRDKPKPVYDSHPHQHPSRPQRSSRQPDRPTSGQPQQDPGARQVDPGGRKADPGVRQNDPYSDADRQSRLAAVRSEYAKLVKLKRVADGVRGRDWNELFHIER